VGSNLGIGCQLSLIDLDTGARRLLKKDSERHVVACKIFFHCKVPWVAVAFDREICISSLDDYGCGNEILIECSQVIEGFCVLFDVKACAIVTVEQTVHESGMLRVIALPDASAFASFPVKPPLPMYECVQRPTCVAASPTGAFIVTGGQDSTVRRFLPSGQELLSGDGLNAGVLSVEVNLTEDLIIANDDKLVCLFDATSDGDVMPVVWQRPIINCNSVFFGPNLAECVVAHKGGLCKLDFSSGMIKYQSESCSADVESVSLSTSREHAVVVRKDGVLRVFDLTTADFFTTFNGGDKRAACISSDGNLIAFGTRTHVHLYSRGNVADPSSIKWSLSSKVLGEGLWAEASTFSDDDVFLAIGCQQRVTKGGYVKMFRTRDVLEESTSSQPPIEFSYPCASVVVSLTFTSLFGGSICVCRQDGYVSFTKLQTGKKLFSSCVRVKKIEGYALSPSFELIAAFGDSDALVLYRVSGYKLVEVCDLSGPLSKRKVQSACFSPDGRFLATVASKKSGLRLYDVDQCVARAWHARIPHSPALRWRVTSRIHRTQSSG
jgi:WD40 repeat protein